MTNFKADFTKIIEKAKGRVDLVVRKSMIRVFESVILKTPVLTGRARGNWIATTGTMSNATLETFDKSGNSTISAAKSVVDGSQVGGITYLVNNLPYASRLEYGYSQQAPSGMVRLSVAEFEQWLKEAARY